MLISADGNWRIQSLQLYRSRYAALEYVKRHGEAIEADKPPWR